MSWWKSGTEQKREVQIESLERAFPYAKKSIQEQDNSCEYDIEFSRGEGLPDATLRVFLPRKFPSDKPILLFRSDIEHPWINQYNQVVGHPYWTKWEKDMDVAIVILEVIKELSTTRPLLPPSPKQSPIVPPKPPAKPHYPPQYPQQNLSQTPPATTNTTSSPPQYHPSQTSTSQSQLNGSAAAVEEEEEEEEMFEIPTPEVPTQFSDLEKLTKEALEKLYNDEVALHDYVSKLPGVNTMQDILADALKCNFNVSNETLAKKEELTQVRSECVNLQSELREIKKQYDDKVNGYLEREKSRSSDIAILGKMRTTSSRIDELSENIHEKLLNKEIEVNDFIKEYRELRKKFHESTASMEMHNHWADRG